MDTELENYKAALLAAAKAEEEYRKAVAKYEEARARLNEHLLKG